MMANFKKAVIRGMVFAVILGVAVLLGAAIGREYKQIKAIELTNAATQEIIKVCRLQARYYQMQIGMLADENDN